MRRQSTEENGDGKAGQGVWLRREVKVKPPASAFPFPLQGSVDSLPVNLGDCRHCGNANLRAAAL